MASKTTEMELLSVQEVADLLGIPKSSVYEQTRFRGSNGPATFPFRKVGRYIKVVASELEDWVLALPHVVNTKKRKYTKRRTS